MINVFILFTTQIIFFVVCITCYLYLVRSHCHVIKARTLNRYQNDYQNDYQSQKDEFIKSKGESLGDLEDELQITEKPDLLRGDLGFKVSNAINGLRKNDQFYFNPNVAVCGVGGDSQEPNKLNCAKPIYGQEFAEGWFV